MDYYILCCQTGKTQGRENKYMHTTEGKKFTFVHHGDYSGDIEIVNNKTQKTIAEIPFEDIKQLVAEWVRGEWIGAIEQMENDTLLVGKLP